MQSTIILGDPEKAHNYISQSYHPKKFHIYTIEPETSNLKLKQIHQLSNQISTIPQKHRLVWIRQAETLTTAAQNALLKLLEEPPTQTSFILETTNLKNLLETITSRCLIKRLEKSSIPLDQKTLQKLKSAMGKNSGERITLAKSIGKKRAQAISWIEKVITSLHQTLQTTQGPQSLKLLNQLLTLSLQTKTSLQNNTNVTLAIENFFLSLPKTATSQT